MDMKSPRSKSFMVPGEVVTIRPIEDKLVHVTINLKKVGVCELPTGGTTLPPPPTGFGVDINFGIMQVTQSSNKAITNVLYQTKREINDTTLEQLTQQLKCRYMGCQVKVNKSRKKRITCKKIF